MRRVTRTSGRRAWQLGALVTTVALVLPLAAMGAEPGTVAYVRQGEPRVELAQEEPRFLPVVAQPGRATMAPQGLVGLPPGEYTVSWDAPPERIDAGSVYRIAMRADSAFPQGTGSRGPVEIPLLSARFAFDFPFRDLTPPGSSGVVASVGIAPQVPAHTVEFDIADPDPAEANDESGYPPTAELVVSVSGSFDMLFGSAGSTHVLIHYPYVRVGGPGGSPSFGCEAPVAAVGFVVGVVAGCEIDIAIDGIEVVQAIQDPAQPIPLVAGKGTVARVFISYTGDSPSVTGVTAHMRARAGSRPLDGEATPLNEPLTLPAPEPRREQTNGSLNFLLPPSWVEAGSITLEATLVIPGGLLDTNAANNTLLSEATFQDSPSFRIAFVPMCPGRAPSDGCVAPTAFDETTFTIALRKMFPVGSDVLRAFPLVTNGWTTKNSLATYTDIDRFRMTLRRLYVIGLLLSADAGGYPDQLVAVVSPTAPLVNLGVGGGSDPPWVDATSDWQKAHTAWVLDTSAVDKRRFSQALAHEIGHNMGLRHTNVIVPECGSRASDPATDWQRADATIGQPGFDIGLDVVVPSNRYDLMSHCPPDKVWISDFHYRKLIASGLRPPRTSVIGNRVASVGGRPVGPAAPALVAAGTSWIVVSGTVSLTEGARLDPAFSIEAARELPSDGGVGSYCVVLSASGAERGSSCFDLEFIDPADHQPLDQQSFALALPSAADVDRVTLTQDGEALATLDAAAAPGISFTTQASGEWSTPQDIAWATTGGVVASQAFYSTDNGSTWLPMAAETDGTRLTVDPATAPDGSSVIFRILASDGVRTAAADLGPVALRGGATAPGGAGPDLDQGIAAAGIGVLIITLAAIWVARRRTPRTAAVTVSEARQPMWGPGVASTPAPRPAPPPPAAPSPVVPATASAPPVATQPAARSCPRCGTVPLETDRFCGTCGLSLTAPGPVPSGTTRPPVTLGMTSPPAVTWGTPAAATTAPTRPSRAPSTMLLVGLVVGAAAVAVLGNLGTPEPTARPGGAFPSVEIPGSPPPIATGSPSATIPSRPGQAGIVERPPAFASDLTTPGIVGASSADPANPIDFAVDLDPATSWFSDGPQAYDALVVGWDAETPQEIGAVVVVGNGQNADTSLRGFGFGEVTVELFLGNEPVGISTQSLEGEPDPTVMALFPPGTTADNMRMTFRFLESPERAGVAEILVLDPFWVGDADIAGERGLGWIFES